jgi:hypothetical protein
LTDSKYTPERCLEAAFRFFLDGEPKESILGCFDVTVISRCFASLAILTSGAVPVGCRVGVG